MPVKDSMRSMKGLICADRIDIAQIRMIEEAHFTYQSIVYFGVADLNILLEFSISSGENRIFSLSSLLSCFGGLFSFMSVSYTHLTLPTT